MKKLSTRLSGPATMGLIQVHFSITDVGVTWEIRKVILYFFIVSLKIANCDRQTGSNPIWLRLIGLMHLRFNFDSTNMSRKWYIELTLINTTYHNTHHSDIDIILIIDMYWLPIRFINLKGWNLLHIFRREFILFQIDIKFWSQSQLYYARLPPGLLLIRDPP